MLVGAGERALAMAEQLARHQWFGDRADVHAEEHVRRARGLAMDGARDELLAGAVLAQDEDVRVGRRGFAISACTRRIAGESPSSSSTPRLVSAASTRLARLSSVASTRLWR